ncbi:DUF4159 domain-containing protein [Sneathiella marina]|uniref:DUF4159 domain-containing protein n=1 Tax=Sneathiella marina TaxID=2950108 RepID=A0ABY4W9C8_9PROT|nr:DUF4159 domain-containing protein [Sneathiella marina]USG61879.1 DUF4159 domain-containing protein [Sneathiella marina]
MAFLSSFSFLFPWVLTALLALPVIWWLLRLVPPKPKTITFPAIQFLYQLKKEEQSSATTPWWLLLLRLLITALIIFALAGPFINLPEHHDRNGPAVFIIDDGWSAANNWTEIKATFGALITDITREQRQIYVVTTAQSVKGVKPTLRPLSEKEALGVSFSILPKSWPSNRSQLLSLIPHLNSLEDPEFIWLSSGVMQDKDEAGLVEFFTALTEIGPLTIFQHDAIQRPPLIGTPKISGETMEIPLYTTNGTQLFSGTLSAQTLDGKILASETIATDFSTGSTFVTLNIPNDIRNDISRIEIKDAENAGSVFLLDHRWHRRQIGLVSATLTSVDQPLLTENHYLTQALIPYFDIDKMPLEELIAKDVSMIALGDTGNLSENIEGSLESWIDNGGVLIRFAGPKLANADTALVPVELRSGNRNLEGAMSWAKPAELGKIPDHSPFKVLEIPDDIKVMKQVLANPSPDLLDRTWAQLEDGTPLVTAQKRGMGWLVLFHITATPDWSDLAISGLFVEMLREIGNLGQFTTENTGQNKSLPPYQILNGFGDLSLDVGAAEPLDTGSLKEMSLNAEHPPGFYGNEDYKIAVNVGQENTNYKVIDPTTFDAEVKPFDSKEVVDLSTPILLLAIFLVLVDQIISLYLQGKLPGRRPVTTSALILLAVSAGYFGYLPNSTAQEANMTAEEKVLAATLDTRLGYILTNNDRIDAMSRAGLTGLAAELRRRTSVEAKSPLPLDIEQDDLVFYPVIYWPVTSDFPLLSSSALSKLNNYIKGGGTVLFDTRNQNSVGGFGADLFNSPENIRLRQLLSKLDIPRLQPVPIDHVLTRSFYLMQNFPGRYPNGELWVEDTAEKQGNDGVASVLIGSNDWAAAWAVGENGKPLAAIASGDERQREMAFRFGINLVMYTLTGNYKADQVHVPAILERLGQ